MVRLRFVVYSRCLSFSLNEVHSKFRKESIDTEKELGYLSY